MVPLPHHTKHADAINRWWNAFEDPHKHVAMVAQVRKTYPDHKARYPRSQSMARTKDHKALVVGLSDLSSIIQAYSDLSICIHVNTIRPHRQGISGRSTGTNGNNNDHIKHN